MVPKGLLGVFRCSFTQSRGKYLILLSKDTDTTRDRQSYLYYLNLKYVLADIANRNLEPTPQLERSMRVLILSLLAQVFSISVARDRVSVRCASR